jgi:hypothetical protein
MRAERLEGIEPSLHGKSRADNIDRAGILWASNENAGNCCSCCCAFPGVGLGIRSNDPDEPLSLLDQ